MLTVLLTCLLAAGATFTPPAGWQIEQIIGGGVTNTMWISPISCGLQGCPEPDRRTRIHLRRSLAMDERVQAPEGCEVSLHGEATP